MSNYNARPVSGVRQKIKTATIIISLVFGLLSTSPVWAVKVDEDPSGAEMAADLLIARPVQLVATLVGSAIFVVALPFSLLGGNTKESANTLVLEPASATFLRCLGCRDTGRKVEWAENLEVKDD